MEIMNQETADGLRGENREAIEEPIAGYLTEVRK